MNASERAELLSMVQELAAAMQGINPDRIYTPAEAADLLGFRGPRAPKSIRELDPALLPLIRLTPGGRIVGYLGRDIVLYILERRKAA